MIKMRYPVAIISIVIIACTSRNPSEKDFQKEILSNSIDTTQIISKIKKQYEEVNENIPKYRKEEKKLIGQSSEGGTLTTFFNEKDPIKIITTFYGETGKAITEYYFNKDELFFAFKTIFYYDKPIDIKGSKIKALEESRYYFFNDKLIKWVKGDKQINHQSNEFQEESKYIKEDIATLRKSLPKTH